MNTKSNPINECSDACILKQASSTSNFMQLASGSACQSLQPKYQQIAKMVFSNKYNPVIYTGSGSQNSFSRRYSIGVLKFSTILTLFYLSPVISTCIYGTHRLRSKLLILRFYATLLVVYQVIDNMLILQFYATHKKMRKETKFHNAISRADLQKL